MPTAILYCLLFAASPGARCAEGVAAGETPRGLFGKVQRHVDYQKRLYYGHYDRHPFDYRFQFDYPWCAGPSQPHWPIAPPAPVYPPDHGPEFEARRASHAKRAVPAAASSLNFNPLRPGNKGK